MTIEQMILSGASPEEVNAAVFEVTKRREEALAQKKMEEERLREEAARKEAEARRQENALDNLFCAAIDYVRALGVNISDEDVKTLRPGFDNMMESLQRDPQMRMLLAFAKLKDKLDREDSTGEEETPRRKKVQTPNPENVFISLL